MTEMIHSLRVSGGGDYTLINTWSTDTTVDLTSANVKVYAGILTGAIPTGAAVTQDSSGATGTTIGPATATQVLINDDGGTAFTSGDAIRLDSDPTNQFFTTSSVGDPETVPVLEGYGTTPITETDALISGATTNATNYRVFRAAPGEEHDGIDPSTGVHMTSSSQTNQMLRLGEPYAVCQQIGAITNGTAFSASLLANTTTKYIGCLVDSLEGSASFLVTNVACSVLACISIDGRPGFKREGTPVGTVVVDNFVAKDCLTGFIVETTDYVFTNCIAYGSTTSWNLGTGTDLGSSNNHADNAQAQTPPGANPGTIDLTPADFEDVTLHNMRIMDTSAQLYQQGLDQSADGFTTDIVGDSWLPQWNIGAFAVAVPTGVTLPIIGNASTPVYTPGAAAAPGFNGNIADINGQEGTALTPVNVSSEFTGGGPVTSYSLQNEPSGMVISSLGVITWPTPLEGTTVNMTVTGTGDTAPPAVSNTFSTIIAAAPALPVITVDPIVPDSTTTAEGSITFDQDGSLWAVASEDPGLPSQQQMLALTDANDDPGAAPGESTGSFPGPFAAGTYATQPAGLSAGLTYYQTWMVQNLAGDYSIPVRSPPFTMPLEIAVLTNQSADIPPFNTVTAKVDTDQNGGDLRYLLNTSATAVEADLLGVGSRSQPVSQNVTQTITWSGAPTNTLVYVHFMQVTVGNSLVVSTAGVTTGEEVPVPPNSTINDAILIVTGGPTINDGLAIWYNKQMSETLNDAEYRWLIEQGATPATVNDMWFEFTGNLGYQGSLNDRQLQYWLNGGAGSGAALVTFEGQQVTHEGEGVTHG